MAWFSPSARCVEYRREYVAVKGGAAFLPPLTGVGFLPRFL